MMKICKKCKKEKNPDTDFYLLNGKLRAECKACMIKRSAIYQKSKLKEILASRNTDKHRQYMREYYQKNKEKFIKNSQRFFERHPNYAKEYSKKYYQKNKKKPESITSPESQ